jgi:hypothetical protein
MFLCCFCLPEKIHRDSLQDILLLAVNAATYEDAEL